MAKNFIIHIPEVGEDLAYWALANDSGTLTADPSSGALAEAAASAEGRRAIVVLPGDDVLLAEAAIPGGSAARAQQAAPFVLEDQVADDIDTLHFALGSKSGDDLYPVAVINKETMDNLREQLLDVGLRPAEVVPETLAIPKFDNHANGLVWTALIDDDQAVVRLNGYKGFATDTGTAEMMLNGAKREMLDSDISGIVVFKTNATHTGPDLPDLEIETRSCESRLGLYAAGLASSPRINLLQGDYSLKQQFDKAWKPWRWSIALLAALLAIFAAGTFVDYFRLGRMEANLDSQIEDVFTDTFPGTPIRNPVVQMKSRLKALDPNAGAGGFTVEMGQIGAAVTAVPKTKLNSISYKTGRFDLDLITDKLPSLDVLKQEIEKAGTLTMTVLSANRQDGGVRSRIRLEAK